MNEHAVLRLPAERIKYFKHTWPDGSSVRYLALVRRPQGLVTQGVSGRPRDIAQEHGEQHGSFPAEV